MENNIKIWIWNLNNQTNLFRVVEIRTVCICHYSEQIWSLKAVQCRLCWLTASKHLIFSSCLRLLPIKHPDRAKENPALLFWRYDHLLSGVVLANSTLYSTDPNYFSVLITRSVLSECSCHIIKWMSVKERQEVVVPCLWQLNLVCFKCALCPSRV